MSVPEENFHEVDLSQVSDTDLVLLALSKVMFGSPLTPMLCPDCLGKFAEQFHARMKTPGFLVKVEEVRPEDLIRRRHGQS